MLRRAHEAVDPEHPERITYVAAIMWPDGEMKQGHFAIDENLYAKMQQDQGEQCPSWEHIVLNMMGQLIEKILTERRNQVSQLIVVPKVK